jgi:hypothetical protein
LSSIATPPGVIIAFPRFPLVDDFDAQRLVPGSSSIAWR